LAAKILSKHGGTQEDIIKDRQANRLARRDAERVAVSEAKRQEAKKLELLAQVVKPYDQAQQHMRELAKEWQQTKAFQTDDDEVGSSSTSSSTNIDEWKQIAESKQMQLDELLALEAIYDAGDDDDTGDTFLVHSSCRLEELREQVEEYMDDQNETVLKSIVQDYPPLSFCLQLIMEDPTNDDMAAFLLLQVTLPSHYPLEKTPIFQVLLFVLTDKTMECSSNKPLESLAYLQGEALTEALSTEAQLLVPDPSVYEVAATWLSEHLFDYVTMGITPL
jgi:hypothetical protein